MNESRLRKLFKRIPYIKAVIRFARRPLMYLEMLDSSNYKFIATFPPGHFYSPLPEAEDLFQHEGELCDRTITEIAGIDLNVARQLELLNAFSRYHNELPFNDHKTSEVRYWLDNGFFSYGDAVILFSVLRHFQPRTVIEVGSGFSSAAMLDTNDLFFAGAINFVFIEPYPERLYELLSRRDTDTYTILQSRVQKVPIGTFSQLTNHDVLFIDSSHISKTGSDVNHLLSQVLPSLATGVIIHFHDIFWPFEYPNEWLLDGRAWNEAYMLKSFLQYNDSFEIIYFNEFIQKHHSATLQEKLPEARRQPTHYPLSQGNSSLWLRKIK